MDNNLIDDIKINNLKPKKSLGQNFLKDDNTITKIADLCMDKNQCIIEIGAGTGVLTEKLSERYKKVFSFEIDDDLIPLLNNKFKAKSNVEIIHKDFLKINIEEFIKEHDLENEAVSVCTNLPYYISSDATYVLLNNSKYFKYIIMLVQKEFADKISLKTGNKDCIPLTYLREYKTSCQKCFNVSPHLFIPQPKVISTVIKMTTIDKYILSPEKEKLLFDLIDNSFLQRRKQLLNSLGNRYKKDVLISALKLCDFDENIRAEQLKLEDFILLTNKIYELTNV